jgi:prepilin peptidase CpaA
MEYAHSLELLKVPLVLALVAACCVTDLGARRIPNLVLLPALAAGLFLNTLGGGLAGFTDSLGGLVIGVGMLMPLYLLGRMGAGDLKLLGVVGAILGAWGAVVAGLATLMAGGLLGLAYIVWLLLKPAVLARVQAIGQAFTDSRTDVPAGLSVNQVRASEIPYAVAIAAGTVAALAYTGLIAEVTIT